MMAQNQVLGTIGKCIYCGVTDSPLSDEHILPLGLGGKWVLRRASCGQCQDITSQIELSVLRVTLLPVRAKADLPTRHRKRRPQEFPLTIEIGGREVTVNVPVDKYPALLTLPRFKLPAYVDRRPYTKGIELDGLYHKVLGGRQCLLELGKELKADSLSITVSYSASEGGFHFARLLGKIAYGLAIAQFGESVIQNAYVLPAILGETDDIGKWVGCVGESSTKTKNLHEIKTFVQGGDIYARIRLFACIPGTSPEYLVVVGPYLATPSAQSYTPPE